MSLVINHNMMAVNTARNLSSHYNRLAVSTERLSTGLRINTAADDPAGMAIREMMRSDIATLQQGIRNAADGISMLQTAEGAMAVIDEKLVRMKELAEQAATGTYTTVQRELINSEYQAMAAEIDRIANATQFNGVKLLDGSINQAHSGKGLKIHFGLGNNEAEDYYFIKIPDIRATSEKGLRIAGDATNDIWGTVGAAKGGNTTGCCGGGIPALDSVVSAWNVGDIFSFGYNWDLKENTDTNLNRGRYIAGAYQADSTPTLEKLIAAVNAGSQARVRIDIQTGTTLGELVGVTSSYVFDNSSLAAYKSANGLVSAGDAYEFIPPATLNSAQAAAVNAVSGAGTAVSGDVYGGPVTLDNGLIAAFELSATTYVSGDTYIDPNSLSPNDSAHRICLGDEVYYVGSASLATDKNTNSGKTYTDLSTVSAALGLSANAAQALARAINSSAGSRYWAKVEEYEYLPGYTSVYVFFKDGGEKKVAACDDQLGAISDSAAQKTKIRWYNDEEDVTNDAGVYFNNGGKHWGTLKAVPTGYGTFGVQLHGKDVGSERDLWILNVGAGSRYDINTDPATGFSGLGFGARMNSATGLMEAVGNYYSLDRDSFVELQNAADGNWDGAHLRTQSAAQEALDAISSAISAKESIRASLGAYQNRLENTITNLEIYAENLQAAESRISDVDIATEMTKFVKNQVLTQAAVSMLSQANSLPQMALSLLNG